MRKYQQLLLVVITVASITILLIYKSENNRLRYVLEAVNFFGRSDAAVLDRLENNTKTAETYHDFSNPLPVWQYIGENFHVYSSFWENRELAAGAETTSIVVGARNALVNFKCGIRYEQEGKVVAGKFAFIRIDTEGSTKPDPFSVYKFLCKVSRDFGGTPESLILTNTKTKADYEMSVRHVKSKETTTADQAAMNICLNLIPSSGENASSIAEFSTKSNVMQFFLFHQAIGVENFLIYNANALSSNIRKILLQAGVRLNLFPYNFPFDQKSPHATRTVVELDCLMRSMYTAPAVMVLEVNEFFYASSNLRGHDSILRSLKHYDDDINRFEVTSFAVCLDHRKKLLIDNGFYDSQRKADHKMFVYKPTMRTDNVKTMPLALTKGLGHLYVNCVGSKDLLYDWKTSIRRDFLMYLEGVRKEVDFLF